MKWKILYCSQKRNFNIIIRYFRTRKILVTSLDFGWDIPALCRFSLLTCQLLHKFWEFELMPLALHGPWQQQSVCRTTHSRCTLFLPVSLKHMLALPHLQSSEFQVKDHQFICTTKHIICTSFSLLVSFLWGELAAESEIRKHTDSASSSVGVWVCHCLPQIDTLHFLCWCSSRGSGWHWKIKLYSSLGLHNILFQ